MKKRWKCACGKKFNSSKARNQHRAVARYYDFCGVKYHTLILECRPFANGKCPNCKCGNYNRPN